MSICHVACVTYTGYAHPSSPLPCCTGERRKAFPRPFHFPSEPASQFPASLIRAQCITHNISADSKQILALFHEFNRISANRRFKRIELAKYGGKHISGMINTMAMFPAVALILMEPILRQPIKVSAQSEAWTVFVHLNFFGRRFESHSRYSFLCLFHISDVLRVGSGLGFATGRFPSKSEFLATDPEVQSRFPALPDFLRSSGSGTGSTQPREYNWLPRGLVVRVPGYRSRGPGSIPGSTRFSEK
jgi:hypothetical protein